MKLFDLLRSGLMGIKGQRATIKQDAAEERAWYENREPGRQYDWDVKGWCEWNARQKAYAQQQANAYYQSAQWQAQAQAAFSPYQQWQAQQQFNSFMNGLGGLGGAYHGYQQPPRQPTPHELETLRMAPVWRGALGFAPSQVVSMPEVDAAFKSLAKKCHPDHGGDAEQMKTLNAARAWAKRELAGDA